MLLDFGYISGFVQFVIEFSQLVGIAVRSY